MKKILFVVCLLLCLIFLFSVPVFSEGTVGGDCGNDGSAIQWSLDKQSGELIISGSGSMKNWSQLASSGDTAAPWRAYASSVKSARVEGNVTLGSYTFSTLKNLKSVTLDDSIRSLPVGAFYGCEALEIVVLPSSLTELGEKTFYGCKSLKTLDFAAGVAKIASDALYGCGSLETISVAEENSVFRSEANCLIEKTTSTLLRGSCNGAIPESIIAIADGAFSGCATLKTVIVPNTVRIMGYGAFAGCTAIESMQLPFVGDRRVMADGSVDGMSEADATAREKINGRLAYLFGESAVPTTIRSITLTDCETLEAEALINCSSLTSLTLPNSLLHIKDGALFGCSGIKEIELSDELVSIGKAAFASCASLETITLPDKVSSVGETAFFGCISLTKVSLGASVNSLGEGVFYSCPSIEELTVFADNAKYYSESNCIVEQDGKKLVVGCKNSVIPSDILVVGVGAFRNCNGLRSVVFPEGLIKIEEYAFENCIGLTEIHFPSSLQTVGSYAFAECTGIVTVKSISDISYGQSVFKNCISMQSDGMPIIDRVEKSLGCTGGFEIWLCLIAIVTAAAVGGVVLFVAKKRK